MNEITINTVQGIGDIFWVYQKIAPYVNQIHWRIWRVGDDDVQFRAKEFLHLLPKSASYSFPLVPHATYHDLAAKTFPLEAVLKHPVVNYAVNRALEDGSDLYEMDPGYTPARFVPLVSTRAPEVHDSLCLFVSGSQLEYVWPTETWAYHARTLLRTLNIKKVRVIGANWDRLAADDVTIQLQRMGFYVENLCKRLTMLETVDVIRSSYFFFGYQSGLSIIAENYNIPQVMIYFPFLQKMMYTWAKPESRRTRYHATTFDNPHVTEFIHNAALPMRVS